MRDIKTFIHQTHILLSLKKNSDDNEIKFFFDAFYKRIDGVFFAHKIGSQFDIFYKMKIRANAFIDYYYIS